MTKVGADTYHEERFADHLTPVNHDRPGIVLISYATHQGAIRNDGEAGAKFGPKAILSELRELYWHDPGVPVYLGSEIVDKAYSLEAVQDALFHEVREATQRGHHVIVLGGDHSLSWPLYRGIEDPETAESLGIINLDAHFDFRDNDEANSGTSFHQIFRHREAQGIPLHYLVAGIYRFTNSAKLFAQAAEYGIKTMEVGHIDGKAILREMAHCERLYLSLCLDVLSSAYAPGVSANDPLGLSPLDVISLIETIVSSGNVIAFSIAETAPPWDDQKMSVKLAARFIACYIQALADLTRSSLDD